MGGGPNKPTDNNSVGVTLIEVIQVAKGHCPLQSHHMIPPMTTDGDQVSFPFMLYCILLMTLL